VDAASLLHAARVRARLSKRALAERAATSPAALVEYERGRRDPTVSTFERILLAAGWQPEVRLRPLAVDPAEAARRLEQVLDLVESLPVRARTGALRFPPLAQALAATDVDVDADGGRVGTAADAAGGR
jgi:transcriptional regulator with XRE-family HTH domain